MKNFPTHLRAGLCLSLVCLSLATVRSQVLLAGWTFNNQQSQTAALTADQGTLAGSAVFSANVFGSDSGLTLNNNGTISMGSGEFLYCPSINSTTYPSLQSGVTIVAWISIAGSPATSANVAAYGLVSGTPPATGNIFAGSTGLGAIGYSVLNSNSSSTTPTVRMLGTLSDESTILGAGSGFNTITVGSENSTAVEFSSTNGQYTYFDDTNGNVVSRGPTTSPDTLGTFSGLALGRLNQGQVDYSVGTTSFTVDEIDVYEGALTPAQINALSPVPVPEPHTNKLLMIAPGALFLFAARRRIVGRVTSLCSPV